MEILATKVACPKCGTQVKAKAKFCFSCGAPMAGGNAVAGNRWKREEDDFALRIESPALSTVWLGADVRSSNFRAGCIRYVPDDLADEFPTVAVVVPGNVDSLPIFAAGEFSSLRFIRNTTGLADVMKTAMNQMGNVATAKADAGGTKPTIVTGSGQSMVINTASPSSATCKFCGASLGAAKTFCGECGKQQ